MSQRLDALREKVRTATGGNITRARKALSKELHRELVREGRKGVRRGV